MRQFWLTIIAMIWHCFKIHNLLVTSVGVLTSSMDTGIWCSAFIHIKVAVSSIEALLASAFVVVTLWMASGLVAARLAGTVVLLGAVRSCPSQRTCALVGVEGGQCAGPTILTWTGVTGIGHTSLTQGILKAQGTLTSEGRSLTRIPRWSQDAGSSILANLFSGITMISKLAILSSVIRRASKMKIVIS